MRKIPHLALPAPDETQLVGRWVLSNGHIEADEICQRIDWLTADHLTKVAVSGQGGGWETLFKDANDGRFWERTYPDGGMHAGEVHQR